MPRDELKVIHDKEGIDSEYWLSDKFKTDDDNTQNLKNQKFLPQNDDYEIKIVHHESFPEYQVRYKEPKICDPSYSGYLDVEETKHFFFWFFESRSNPETDPIVLWLNGGPGCSSLTGLYFELGPCSINEDGASTTFNPYSWNSNSSIIFLDQPLNVGYSYGSGATNSFTAAVDVYAFLQLFFKEFPKYAELDFHIAGESYAGHYIPAMATEIHENNKNISSVSSYSWIRNTKLKNLKYINLDSILIGNGLVDPLIQYKYYPDMACNSSYPPVVDDRTCDKMRNAYPRCAKLITNCYNSPNVFTCYPPFVYCNREIVSPYMNTGRNPYDVRKDCDGGGLCYPILDAIEKYSNLMDVKLELGADPQIKYESCNMDVNTKFSFSGDWMRPFQRLIPPLLEDNIRVLIYNGDADFVCNWIGSFAWVKELPWSGKPGFNLVETKPWKTRGKNSFNAGEITSFEQFTFLRIFEAGHMVPYDQPYAGLDFFNSWLTKKLS
ncbi:9263_t:CDS:10 [Diversispora eburnea]|uniref:Carboxypeptidase n=1 Tax=Diversispora eburnea TaxID=1213867 RepID=A0A9N8YV81_9GLOM|nr:9263_t:CDS:10 [Diversispora eburnea]